MKSLLFATLLLACSCSTPPQQQAPSDLHAHLSGGRSQITPVFASNEAMAEAVAAAVAAQSLRVVKTEGGESWGRVAAVDERGFSYVLTWEPATGEQPGAECVLLMISCDPKGGAVSVGQLAQAVRTAAESSG